jgi:hypothetical protein
MKIFSTVTDRNTVSSSDPLLINESTLLHNTLNNIAHTPKKMRPIKNGFPLREGIGT